MFFQHPISNIIQWNDLIYMLKGIYSEFDFNINSGKTKVKLNECEIILPKQTHKFIASHKEVIELRHFFENTGYIPSTVKG